MCVYVPLAVIKPPKMQPCNKIHMDFKKMFKTQIYSMLSDLKWQFYEYKSAI